MVYIKLYSLLIFSCFSCLSFSGVDRVDGTNVYMDPPERFFPSNKISGFYREDIKSSIIVTQFNTPVVQLWPMMKRESLSGNGKIFIESRSPVVSGFTAKFAKIKHTIDGVEFYKFLLLFGGSEKSVFISGSIPVSVGLVVERAVIRSMFSVNFEEELDPDIFEGLGFTIGESKNLKYYQNIHKTVFWKALSWGNFEPMFIAGFQPVSSIYCGENIPLKRFRPIIKNVVNIKIIESGLVVVDGISFSEIVSSGFSNDDSVSVVMYQAAVQLGSECLVVNGIVDKKYADIYVNEFKDLLRGTTIK